MPSPVLRAVLLCADALADDEGDYDLQGVFRQIVIEEFPATVGFKVFVMWAGHERRDQTLAVEVKGPSVTAVRLDDVTLPAVENGFYDQVGLLPVEVDLGRIGDLYIELRLDGQPVSSFFVPVLQRTFSPTVDGRPA